MTAALSPVRLQLSRRPGFDLHAHSLAVNGLPAVTVTRPGPWGNPYRIGLVRCGCRTADCPHNAFRVATAAEAVEAFRDWRGLVQGRALPERVAACLAPLRGKTLACCCPLHSPCHADALLEFANR